MTKQHPSQNKSTAVPLRHQPLAARMRPQSLDNFVGQTHLLAEGKPLRQAILAGHLHSMIFWGPPGSGKTTLARLIASHADAEFHALSAVLAGVKDIRAAVEQAQELLAQERKTILFVDEVHRFNKAQQDAFLPFVENGTITFIGATTENPSFEVNNALLSRVRVYVLKALTVDDILKLLKTALTDMECGIGQLNLQIDDALLKEIALWADGDARRALNIVEILTSLAKEVEDRLIITAEELAQAIQGNYRRFDKGSDIFYEQISALHKAVRGSAPDAALYWLVRMLDGGCDPLYIARRVVRMASEDIGNADPRGLSLALNAWDVQERLGSPEGELALAQAVIYLACAAKSNAVYTAFNAAKQDVKQHPSYDVPLHLRNAPTRMMKAMDYGAEYRYAHAETQGYAAGENYFPEALKDKHYYFPVDRGMEAKIKEKLDYLRSLDKKSQHKRYESA